jgi:tRNA uridine 5-carboxymethylaminomethyl modification enzyme
MLVFDVIVIGGGHAGSEAAHAAARMGCETALVTLDLKRIGVMSCNPAIGGLAKGQLVKEIDAMGGLMGRITDLSAIQYRRLNASKGPAVRSSRAQCDRHRYAQAMSSYLANMPQLRLIGSEVVELLCNRGRVLGVRLADGSELQAQAVVVTTGTFLRGKMYTGLSAQAGGRLGDLDSKHLSQSLERLGFLLRRLKTGTPPRLHRQSIDFSCLEPQLGDEKPLAFSFFSKPEPFPFLPQLPCHITYTNPQTHEIIASNFSQSPMFSGLIQGIGPRYCPSIEDKVKRFEDRTRHQIFLEPEGLESEEIYVNGISTSLPQNIQEQFVRTIRGLEKAEFVRYGYAVEYDCIDARQLRMTLESKDIAGLFFSGQINGTSGYEEAAAQGLMAGVNAALLVQGKAACEISRTQAYLGVLLDDLILKGTDEPYRMFTSRAEHRLWLREDNADLRLSEKGHQLGLLSDEHYALVQKRRAEIERLRSQLKTLYFFPEDPVNVWLASQGKGILKDRVSVEAFLKRPEVHFQGLFSLGWCLPEAYAEDVQEQVEIQIKYEGYINRELQSLESVRKSEQMRIPWEMNYEQIAGLSHEVKDRLMATRPETIGHVSRMVGMTPAAVANLVIFLKMHPQGFVK